MKYTKIKQTSIYILLYEKLTLSWLFNKSSEIPTFSSSSQKYKFSLWYYFRKNINFSEDNLQLSRELSKNPVSYSSIETILSFFHDSTFGFRIEYYWIPRKTQVYFVYQFRIWMFRNRQLIGTIFFFLIFTSICSLFRQKDNKMWFTKWTSVHSSAQLAFANFSAITGQFFHFAQSIPTVIAVSSFERDSNECRDLYLPSVYNI